jgi:hypothetical protein
MVQGSRHSCCCGLVCGCEGSEPAAHKSAGSWYLQRRPGALQRQLHPPQAEHVLPQRAILAQHLRAASGNRSEERNLCCVVLVGADFSAQRHARQGTGNRRAARSNTCSMWGWLAGWLVGWQQTPPTHLWREQQLQGPLHGALQEHSIPGVAAGHCDGSAARGVPHRRAALALGLPRQVSGHPEQRHGGKQGIPLCRALQGRLLEGQGNVCLCGVGLGLASQQRLRLRATDARAVWGTT